MKNMDNIFSCPFLNDSDGNARCEAALSSVQDNSIKNMNGSYLLDFCINKKRRFEACHFYFSELRRSAVSKLPWEIESLDSRSHAFDSL